MVTVTLGKTGITVNKNGFGALPIQRISKEDAAYLLRKAYDSGVNFFDTARAYSDSEEKVGYAFRGIREKLYISTKTAAQNADDFWKDLHTSLTNLQTDYVDILQFHNPAFCPRPGDGTGLYEAMVKAKEEGKGKGSTCRSKQHKRGSTVRKLNMFSSGSCLCVSGEFFYCFLSQAFRSALANYSLKSFWIICVAPIKAV